MDSTDCSITNNSTVAAHTGSVLIADRSVQAGALLDWRFYGAVVPIPAGVHTLTLCATGGDLNVDYLKFKLENLGDAGESPAATVLYSGPTPKNLCLSKSCHDSGLDTALAAKMTADAIAEAHAGDANSKPACFSAAATALAACDSVGSCCAHCKIIYFHSAASDNNKQRDGQHRTSPKRRVCKRCEQWCALRELQCTAATTIATYVVNARVFALYLVICMLVFVLSAFAVQLCQCTQQRDSKHKDC
eukprot:15692-Heterococcus_DN1.PRE.1